MYFKLNNQFFSDCETLCEAKEQKSRQELWDALSTQDAFKRSTKLYVTSCFQVLRTQHTVVQ